MKIVTWNCNGAIRKKLDYINELDADLYVIQECENPETSTKTLQKWATSYLWSGGNKNKGIGVFAMNDLKLEKLNWQRKFKLPGAPSDSVSATWNTADLKEFLPFRVNNQFNAVAAWTKQSPGGTFGYAGQLWKYLQSHGKDIKVGECMLLGDLNSNIRWDRPDRWWNHSDNVKILDSLGLKSIYHEHSGLKQGSETEPTFYMYRHKDKSYHIDYVFASESLCKRCRMIYHDPDHWLQFSDHIPLEVNLLQD
jgi:exonuclease III